MSISNHCAKFSASSTATLDNIAEVLKGGKNVSSTVIFTLVGTALISYLVMLYKRSPETTKIKYSGYIGFFIIYARHHLQ